MVRYLDPEHENTVRAQRRRGLSAAQRLARERERNAQLGPQQAFDRAREAALTMLDSQARSSGEIAQRLAQRGFATDTVEGVIARLQELNLLDDLAYARMLVRTRFAERGLVGRALRQELAKKAIPDDLAQLAMEQIEGAQIEEMALELARKKARSSGDIDPQRLRRRAVAFLGRKGYDTGQALRAIDAVLEERERD